MISFSGPDATQVGAVVFSENVILEFPMNRYTSVEQLKNAISRIQYMGMTTNTPEGTPISLSVKSQTVSSVKYEPLESNLLNYQIKPLYSPIFQCVQYFI